MMSKLRIGLFTFWWCNPSFLAFKVLVSLVGDIDVDGRLAAWPSMYPHGFDA